MRFGTAFAPHPEGNRVVVYVYEEDSRTWMQETIHEDEFDMYLSADELIGETVRSLQAQLRFNLEMPLADS